MVYADYEFYKKSFFGIKIPEDDFLYFAARASEYLDSLRFSETDEISLSKACCACAEIMYSSQPDKQLMSEKAGDYSVTYASSQTNVSDDLFRTAKKYINIPTVGWI